MKDIIDLNIGSNEIDRDIDIDKFFYINNNIDTILENEDIKKMFHPDNNKYTKKLIDVHDYSERDAYVLSYFLRYLMLKSLV